METYELVFAGVIGGIYLLPLILSAEAKRDLRVAASLVLGTALLISIVISGAYLLGAGLVGPLSLSDYAFTIAAYTLPGAVVWLAWAMIVILGRRGSADQSGN